jgi:hypothetical protein
MAPAPPDRRFKSTKMGANTRYSADTLPRLDLVPVSHWLATFAGYAKWL